MTFDFDKVVPVTIPGWVYTNLWNWEGFGPWQGKWSMGIESITMEMTVRDAYDMMAYLRSRIEQAMLNLFDYPPAVTSAATAYQFFYYGVGQTTVRKDDHPDDLDS